jgi:hypothetical protein
MGTPTAPRTIQNMPDGFCSPPRVTPATHKVPLDVSARDDPMDVRRKRWKVDGRRTEITEDRPYSSGPPVKRAPRLIDGCRAGANLSPIGTSIGGKPAQVQWAGIAMAGKWQLKVQVPADIANCDAAVTGQIGRKSTQAGAFVAVQGPQSPGRFHVDQANRRRPGSLAQQSEAAYGHRDRASVNVR